MFNILGSPDSDKVSKKKETEINNKSNKSESKNVKEKKYKPPNRQPATNKTNRKSMPRESEDGIEPDFLTKFSCGKAPLTPELIEEFLHILPKLTCEVKTTLNWPDLENIGKFRLVIDLSKTVKGKNYAMSSEHLAVFARIVLEKNPNFNIPVIVKYHLLRKNKDSVLVQNMSQKHCESIIKNYNTLANSLNILHKDNRFTNIKIVGVCIATSAKLGLLWNTNESNLWIEQYVPGFTKLWDKVPTGGTIIEKHLKMVSTSDHPSLIRLQKTLYEEFFNSKCTIADIQGCVSDKPLVMNKISKVKAGDDVVVEYPWEEDPNGSARPRKPSDTTVANVQSNGGKQEEERHYILCDVEFTTTLRAKFNTIEKPYHTNDAMIAVAKANWEKLEADELKLNAKNQSCCTIS